MEVFARVADLPADDRGPALEAACDGDAALARAVNRMLAADASPPGWLDDDQLEDGAVARAAAASDDDAADAASAPAGDVTRVGRLELDEAALAAAGGSVAPLDSEVPVRGAVLAAARLPERIGPFRILRHLGTGGMGTVYEAEQDRPRRTVALKLVRAAAGSPDAARRFEIEVQSLGRLRHPGIAALLEVGVHETATGCEPWIAMEYVPGARSIVRYAEEHDLDRDARLALLAELGDAVHHGHLRGVIHRDLKPDNVLVDEQGRVRVIDFGVARAAGIEGATITGAAATRSGQWIGTPRYMSPEQCSGRNRDVDVRTDTWAIGVIAYELLTGHAPHGTDDSVVTLARRIVEEPPPSPRRFDPRLGGDVSAVLLKALEKSAERRYQSASDLAEEFRRILAGAPVAALHHRRAYVLRRWIVRRRRPLAVGLIAAVVLAVVGTTLTSAARERAARERVVTLVDLIRDQRRIVNPFEPLDADPRSISVFEDAVAGLQPGDPDLDESELRILLSELRIIEGAYDKATPHAEQALALRLAESPPDPARVAEARHQLGKTRFWNRRLDDARHEYRSAVEQWREAGDGHREALANSLNDLAEVHRRRAEYAASRLAFEESLAIRRADLPPTSLWTVATLNNMALLLRDTGELDAAESRFRAALDGILGHLDTIPAGQPGRERMEPYVLRTMRSIVTCRMQAADGPGARTMLDRTLARAAAAPAEAVRSEHRWARLLDADWQVTFGAPELGRAAAASLIRELEAETPRLAGRGEGSSGAGAGAVPPPNLRLVARADLVLGRAHLAAGRPDAAAGPIRRAAAGLRRGLGSEHPDLAPVRLAEARRLAAIGDEAGAAAELDAASALLVGRFGPDHPRRTALESARRAIQPDGRAESSDSPVR